MKENKFFKYVLGIISIFVMVAFMHINLKHSDVFSSNASADYSLEIEDKGGIVKEAKIVKFILVKIFQSYEFDRKA